MFADFESMGQLDHWIRSYLEWKRVEGPVVFLDSQLDGHASSAFGYIATDPVSVISVSDGNISFDKGNCADAKNHRPDSATDVNADRNEDLKSGRKGDVHSVCNENLYSTWNEDLQSSRATGRTGKTNSLNSWDALQQFRNHHRDWMFGWLGYDLKNDIEPLESNHADPVGLPDLFFFVPATVIRIDRKSCNVHLIKGNPAELQRSIDKANSPNTEIPAPTRSLSVSKSTSTCKSDSHPDSQFQTGINIEPLFHQSAVERSSRELFRIGRLESGLGWKSYRDKVLYIKERIARGDTYEVNLTHQLQAAFSGDPLDLFESMRSSGPVPFAAWIHYGDFEVCCSSPERFLQRQGRCIISQPIKGTSARGKTPEEDRRIVKEILQKEKNRAENVMIVDLVRHDLGQVAQTGSVRTDSLLEVQTFSTLHQLVSTISADLKPGTSSVEVIKACFPMGSMTGAPKIRTMQIIEELENYRRGLYSGAIGYFTPEDDFDFNVVIRTAIITRDGLFYSIGGAVTTDSDPKEEWDETWLKAETLRSIPCRKGSPLNRP